MAPVRTFISFDPPPAAREAMSVLQKELISSGADVHWEPPGKFHATLKFLGDVDEPRLPEVIALAASACAAFEPIPIAYRGVGAFPDARHPKVLWIGCVDDSGSLGILKRALDDALRPAGFEPEARAFHPHVTLGRVRGPRGLGNLTPKLEKLTFDFQAGIVPEILVMKSVLRPLGAEYTVLTSLVLHS